MAYRSTERVRARLTASRERIVDAALGILAEHGYAGCSVAAVAERAGLATGSVYRHFPAKADLFAEVFRTASQREIDAVTRAATAEHTAAARSGPSSRPSPAGRYGRHDWRTPCSPSRSIRRWRRSGWSSGGPTRRCWRATSPTAWPAVSCRRRIPS
ncbi:TetR/AcrR family transcriptional regulator [Verrucosispora sioxanthis]|uniref:TetR/AcrR family transcriptional regulator n=1 Tax=Verrucosispora sioxanthis TaxID=2499994 RepID=UPI001AA03FF8|nr:helix-turn-helix domain-containing protein [Verrucosispora sioxanthis]